MTARAACALILALGACVSSAWATRLPREVVGGGATVASGSGKRLSGTVGQAVIGPAAGSGSGERLLQGFWPVSGAIVVAVDPPGGIPHLPSSVRFGAATPNPSSGDVRFALSLPSESHVELLVTDVQGRVSTRLDAGRLSAGAHVLSFDAARVTSPGGGMWFARLLVDGRGSGTRRFIRLR